MTQEQESRKKATDDPFWNLAKKRDAELALMDQDNRLLQIEIWRLADRVAT